MVCCLLCFGDGPIAGDPRAGYGRKWAVGMMDAPCKDIAAFCCTFLPCCFPIGQYKLRVKALGGDMSQYKCCQGYYDCRCFKAGNCGDKGNPCCLCLEACCCSGPVVSSTRMLVMDSYDISPDPCDNRIMRFNNCMQMLACVCHILAMFEPSFRDLADLIDCIADLVFFTVAGCMAAQTNVEMDTQSKGFQANFNNQVPKAWNKAGGAMGGQTVAPANQQMDRGYPQQQQQQQQGYPQQQQQQQMMSQQQMMPQQQQQFMVQVPMGAMPGQQIQVQNPQGMMMMVQVPQGAMPGGTFMVVG